jgi:hypothetical protein
MLIAPEQLARERGDQRRFAGAGWTHHGDGATWSTEMFEGRRPNQPQVTVGFHATSVAGQRIIG